MIVACDGLWDFVSEAMATTLVYQQLREDPRKYLCNDNYRQNPDVQNLNPSFNFIYTHIRISSLYSILDEARKESAYDIVYDTVSYPRFDSSMEIIHSYTRSEISLPLLAIYIYIPPSPASRLGRTRACLGI